jgi:hypothetical protein
MLASASLLSVSGTITELEVLLRSWNPSGDLSTWLGGGT